MAGRVNAPLVVANTENGRVIYLYRGDVVPDEVTEESQKNLRDLGFVTDDDGEQKPARRSSGK